MFNELKWNWIGLKWKLNCLELLLLLWSYQLISSLIKTIDQTALVTKLEAFTELKSLQSLKVKMLIKLILVLINVNIGLCKIYNRTCPPYQLTFPWYWFSSIKQHNFELSEFVWCLIDEQWIVWWMS